jgi:phosphomannomutase
MPGRELEQDVGIVADADGDRLSVAGEANRVGQ